MPDQEIKVPDEVRLLAGLINNVGLGAGRDGAKETAVAMLRRAVALDPFDLGRRVNLASMLIGIGEDDEAEVLLTSALGQSDQIVSAWQMLGTVKTHRGLLGEAIQCFQRSLELAPGHPQATFDLAAAYLRAGDFASGLPLYEHRAAILPRTAPPPPAPRWTGEHVGHLCVWGDQGYGDRVMFARFLPWARERCDKLTFLTDPYTVPLLYGYTALGDVGCFYDPKTQFDAQVCLTSLPLLYGLTPDNIPPDPGLVTPAVTSNRLAAPGLKVGIVWAGSKEHPNDDIRSMPFTEMVALAGDPRNDVFSLQCGPFAADIARNRAQRIVGDMSGMIEGEWAHTAAVIQNLDLVVTVDTAIAHVAGALGVRTFLLLSMFNDWRWLHGRDDTPWYPSVRLFRQRKPRDWREVMGRVLGAVNQIHRDRSITRALNVQLRSNGSFDSDKAIKAGQVAAAGATTTEGVYEPDVVSVMKRVLRPGDTFVDVGAYVGKHAVRAAELVGPTGRVLAFEPGENNLPALREAVAGLPQVEIIEQPAFSHAGEVTFHLCADGGDGNALWDPGDHPHNGKSREFHEIVALQATTLDSELATRGLARVAPRLIKIDTEGADQRVLEGASALLSSASKPPFVIAELHEFGLSKFACTQQSLRELMRGHGYSVFLLPADGSRPRHLSDDRAVDGRWIINLLFSTPAAVDELWPKLAPAAPARAGAGRLERAVMEKLDATPVPGIALKSSNGAGAGAQFQTRG